MKPLERLPFFIAAFGCVMLSALYFANLWKISPWLISLFDEVLETRLTRGALLVVCLGGLAPLMMFSWFAARRYLVIGRPRGAVIAPPLFWLLGWVVILVATGETFDRNDDIFEPGAAWSEREYLVLSAIALQITGLIAVVRIFICAMAPDPRPIADHFD